MLAQTWSFLLRGGPVMVPLAATSLVLWTLVFERLIVLWRRRGDGNGDVSGFPFGWVASGLRRGSTGDPERDRRLVETAVREEVRALQRGLPLISALTGVAPLLGLLGTITGMINTFSVLTFHGTGNARALAGGISEALITTECGLLIAIPGLYVHHRLCRRIEHRRQQLERRGRQWLLETGGEAAA